MYICICMQVTALNILILTQGNPRNWETTGSCSQIKTLGLMSEPAVLSEQKLKNFTIMDYNCAKNLLGIAEYDFYFEARNETTGQLFIVNSTTIQKGIIPPAGSEAIFSVRKAFTDQNNVIDITMGVWYE